jgi:anti-sigma factor RsiW
LEGLLLDFTHTEARVTSTPNEHEMLPAYALGVLNDDEEVAFEEHLASCSRCQAELAQVLQVVDVLEDVDAEALLAANPPARSRDLGSPAARGGWVSRLRLAWRPTLPAEARNAWGDIERDLGELYAALGPPSAPAGRDDD